MKYLIIIGVILVIIGYLVSKYNSLIILSKRVDKAFASIDVQLKKRYDLIPNLVSSVKEYMTHEKELLENISALRSKALSKDLTTGEKIKIDQKMTSMLSALNVQFERYPEIKANENIMHLQSSLSQIEESIANSRNYYNDEVTNYNTKILVFPDLLIAKLFGFKAKELYEASEEERENVDVSELFKK